MSTYTHKDILKLLEPIELQDEIDREIEGKHLDQAQEASDELLENIFPNTADKLLVNFESLFKLVVAEDATKEERKTAVIAKINEKGGLSIPYFKKIAQSLGFDIEIKEYKFFRADINVAGDETCDLSDKWIWTVKTSTEASAKQKTKLENVFNKLKPPESFIEFEYS